MTVIQTVETTDPHNAALVAGIILAGDKGVGNRVEETSDGWLMIADDDRAILFKRSSMKRPWKIVCNTAETIIWQWRDTQSIIVKIERNRNIGKWWGTSHFGNWHFHVPGTRVFKAEGIQEPHGCNQRRTGLDESQPRRRLCEAFDAGRTEGDTRGDRCNHNRPSAVGEDNLQAPCRRAAQSKHPTLRQTRRL